jgi:hypothetical protein
LDHPSTSAVNERLRAVIERPVFIVAPPASGGSALFRSRARASGIFSGQGPVLDGIFELEPENREWDSNQLTTADLEARAVEELRGRLPRLHCPEIAGEGADAAINSFVLFEAQPAAG